jgi:peptidoglycan/LPS O-acetylase OafA/YrhL
VGLTVQSDVITPVRAVSPSPTPGRSRMSGLDGLRAIAVAGVLLYHAGVRSLPGGFLGVDLFFVISGFLITWLLVAERRHAGSISIRRFYLRRARRLLPALVTMVATTTGFMALFFRADLAQARGDVAAAAGYFSNWWYVWHHRSYFVAAGRQPPLQHLWSLAVEEQFYLIWPLVIAVLLLGRVRLRFVVAIATGGALASASWMWVLAVRGNVPFDTDSSRLYFGTDTHASALLLGAAAAAVMAALASRRAATGRQVGRAISVCADGAALAALGGVCWAMHRVSEVTPSLYRGGFFVFAALAAVAVVGVSLPGSVLGRVLDVAPIRWVGTRSYGLYLWHWPVFVYTRPGLDWQLHGLTATGVRLALTGVLTELSFRLVERPIRERGFGSWLRLPRPALLASPAWRVAAPMLGAVVGMVAVVGATTAVTHHRPQRPSTSDAVAPLAAFPTVDLTAPPSTPAAISHRSVASPVIVPAASPKPAPSTRRPPAKPSPASTPPAGQSSATSLAIPAGPPPPLTAVGDSVMVDGAVALQRDCPGAEVYAVVGWQAKSVFAEIDALRAAQHLGGIVVIGTGTNGAVSPAELDATLTALADRAKVVVINNHMDRPWEPPNNTMFPQVVKAHPNAVLVDWDTAANTHPDWLSSDGVHLQPAGRAPYADLIKAAAGC